MKLTYYRDTQPNFGDEINALLWDRLLPADFLDDDSRDLFLGIGSIIFDSYPATSHKHVIGSGYGAYTDPPDLKDGTWNVVWVRGPLTAQTLGLDGNAAITDAAVLLRALRLSPPARTSGAAFMPHYESIGRGNWQTVCDRAGVTYLDPTRDPVELIGQIQSASVLITEAMHGAIVADALRTPFIAVTPTHRSHRFKWGDWAQSVGLELNAVPPILSSTTDAYVHMTGMWGEGRAARLLRGRAMTPIADFMADRAAARFRKLIASHPYQLSTDARISSLTDQSLDRLDAFVRSHQR